MARWDQDLVTVSPQETPGLLFCDTVSYFRATTQVTSGRERENECFDNIVEQKLRRTASNRCLRLLRPTDIAGHVGSVVCICRDLWE